MLNTIWATIAELWCKLMHPAPMWPVHGHYRCRSCWREYLVCWEPRLFVAAPVAADPLTNPEDSPSSGSRVARPVPTW